MTNDQTPLQLFADGIAELLDAYDGMKLRKDFEEADGYLRYISAIKDICRAVGQ